MKKKAVVTFVFLSIVVLVIVNFLILQTYGDNIGITGEAIGVDTGEEEPEEEIPQTHTVILKRLGPDPEELRIKKGDSVIWINENVEDFDTIIPLGAFEPSSDRIFVGENFTHIFNEAGEFEYVSIVSEIKGKVVVE